MDMNFATSASIVIVKKTVVQKTSILTAVSAILAGSVFAISSANAAPEIAISSPVGSSTTVVEQYSNGKTATITATPNGISMQDGMP